MIRRAVTRLELVAESSPVYGVEIKSPKSAISMLQLLLENEAQEVVVTIIFDSKRKVMGFAEVTRGTVYSSLVHPREVFGPAIRLGGSYIILAHNHPSGDPSPSMEDNAVTTKIAKSGEILGVPLMDHIIIGHDEKYYSYRESSEHFLTNKD